MSSSKPQREAARLLELAGNRAAPVDVNEVASMVGLQIIYEDLGQDVSGLLVTRGSTGVVGVHSRHAVVRQRFTVAHEIGHFVLRHHIGSEEHVHVDEGWKVSARNENSTKGIDKHEIEANQFAANLLMPEPLLRERVAALGERPLSEIDVLALAKEFKVSEQAMTLRLRNLKL